MRSLQIKYSGDPAALLTDFRSGNDLAFKYIFDQNHRSLYWMVTLILEDPEDVKDVVAKSFASLYRERETIYDAGSIPRYLFVVARNAALDQIKRLKSKQKAQDEIGQYPEPEYEDPHESEIDYARQMEKIALEVENLPPRRRMIFELHYYLNKSTRSIAKQMNIAEQTVRNQLNKARIHLRQVLQ